MKRSGPLRRISAKQRRLKREIARLGDEIQREAWKLDLGPCLVCPYEGGECSGQVQGHHIISKMALKRRGLHEHLWDIRNRLPVCTYRHEQATVAYRQIPLGVLPPEAWEFATELSLLGFLYRHYAEDARG